MYVYTMNTNRTAQMIARRASKGFNAAESAVLLADLLARHAGENLVAALVFDGFATEGTARRAVAAANRTAAPLDTIRAEIARLPLVDLVAQVEALEVAARTDTATRLVYAIAATEAARRLGVPAATAASSQLGAADFLRLAYAAA